MTFSKTAQLGTGKTQKARSRRRKRRWSDFQLWAYEVLAPWCQRCSMRLVNGVQPPNLSHIEHRGMGGTTREWINDLENIRVLCQKCHDEAPGWGGAGPPPFKESDYME